MKTYNQAPYYDDFSDDKHFYQIMFRPGYAVQARELTQLQTIIRSQIERFGNHIFKHGSVVIPGNTYADLNVPFIKIDDTNINVASLEGSTIIGSTNGVYANVIKAVPSTNTEPAVLYLSYIRGNTTGIDVFQPSEQIQAATNTSISSRVLDSTQSPIGFGSLAFINSGVFYIFGSFVHVTAQSVVLSKFDSLPSCHVLLKINESIITANSDQSLLDPARGSYNYAAPGADRIQIVLDFVSLPLGSSIDENYVELMRYENGVLKINNQYPQYSELEKTLARRNYDESGDYIVRGFNPSVREHLKTKYNNGVYLDGDKDKFIVEVSSGKGYISGFETETIAPTYLESDKARTSSHIKSKLISTEFKYGSFVYTTDFNAFIPDFTQRELVGIYNGSVRIGECRPFAVVYETNSTDSGDTDIYRLYYSDVSFYDPSHSFASATNLGKIDDANIIYCKIVTRLTIQTITSPLIEGSAIDVIDESSTIRSAIVKKYDRSRRYVFITKDESYDLPIVNDIITQGSISTFVLDSTTFNVVGEPSLLFRLPTDYLKSLKSSDDSYDIQYSVWKVFSVSTGATQIALNQGVNTQFETFSTDNPLIATYTKLYTIQDYEAESGINVDLALGGTVMTFEPPLSEPIKVIARVNKFSGNTPKRKALEPNGKVVVFNPDVYNKSIPLVYEDNVFTDIQSITGVYLFPEQSIYNMEGKVDVTDYFTLDNGQRDTHYGVGRVDNIKTLPEGFDDGRLEIHFSYFRHIDEGDYFSIDSYESMDIMDIPSFKSSITKSTYLLKDCLDFRPTIINESNQFNIDDIPIVNSFVNTSCQYYIGRIDKVYVDKNRVIDLVHGIPSESPEAPEIPFGSIELGTIFVPPYTSDVSKVVVKPTKNTRFTMRDIQSLSDRISNVEYYSTLGAIESSLINMNIIDPATGLNRYKTGYLVDTFNSPFSICNYFNEYNQCSFVQRKLTAARESHLTNFEYTIDSNCKVTGSKITLDYEEVPFVVQNNSSQTTQLNPFMAIEWDGLVRVTPSYSSLCDVSDLSSFITGNSSVNLPRGINVFDLKSIQENSLLSASRQAIFDEYQDGTYNYSYTSSDESEPVYITSSSMMSSQYKSSSVIVPMDHYTKPNESPDWSFIMNIESTSKV